MVEIHLWPQVTTEMDPFDVEFAQYPFTLFIMIWHAKSRYPKRLIFTIERVAKYLRPEWLLPP
jgi:hypothetical protein